MEQDLFFEILHKALADMSEHDFIKWDPHTRMAYWITLCEIKNLFGDCGFDHGLNDIAYPT